MEKIWEIFPALTEVVRQAHVEAQMEHGHNFDHALRVAQMALFVAENPQVSTTRGGRPSRSSAPFLFLNYQLLSELI